jgi:hypothetical protein
MAWNEIISMLYILAKTHQPNNRDSFICLVECIRDLYPELWYQRALANFMHQEKIKQPFDWTYKLDMYINLLKRREGQLNIDTFTLEQMNEKYSFVTKPVWSSVVWYVMHYIAANLPRNLHEQQKVIFRAFIVCLYQLLPCRECQEHMHVYLQQYELGYYLSQPSGAFIWTWEFHNAVNNRLKKPLMNLEDAYRLYIITKNRLYDNENYTVISEEFV